MSNGNATAEVSAEIIDCCPVTSKLGDSVPGTDLNPIQKYASIFQLQIMRRIVICMVSFALLTSCNSGSTIVQTEEAASPGAVNINTASLAELQRIPGFGDKLAAGIVDFRRKHGPFRRPEHLLLINGVGDRRFHEIRRLVRVE